MPVQSTAPTEPSLLAPSCAPPCEASRSGLGDCAVESAGRFAADRPVRRAGAQEDPPRHASSRASPRWPQRLWVPVRQGQLAAMNGEDPRAAKHGLCGRVVAPSAPCDGPRGLSQGASHDPAVRGTGSRNRQDSSTCPGSRVVLLAIRSSCAADPTPAWPWSRPCATDRTVSCAAPRRTRQAGLHGRAIHAVRRASRPGRVVPLTPQGFQVEGSGMGGPGCATMDSRLHGPPARHACTRGPGERTLRPTLGSCAIRPRDRRRPHGGTLQGSSPISVMSPACTRDPGSHDRVPRASVSRSTPSIPSQPRVHSSAVWIP